MQSLGCSGREWRAGLRHAAEFHAGLRAAGRSRPWGLSELSTPPPPTPPPPHPPTHPPRAQHKATKHTPGAHTSTCNETQTHPGRTRCKRTTVLSSAKARAAAGCSTPGCTSAHPTPRRRPFRPRRADLASRKHAPPTFVHPRAHYARPRLQAAAAVTTSTDSAVARGSGGNCGGRKGATATHRLLMGMWINLTKNPMKPMP